MRSEKKEVLKINGIKNADVTVQSRSSKFLMDIMKIF